VKLISATSFRGPVVATKAPLTILAVESNLAAVYERIRFTIKLSIPMNQIILGIIYMRLIWYTYVPVKYCSGIYRLGSTGGAMNQSGSG